MKLKKLSNCTDVPNEIFDIWIPILNGLQLKVLFVIIRKTIGCNRVKSKFTLVQLQKLTAKSKTAVIKSLNVLLEHKLIQKTKIGEVGEQEVFYQLNIE